LLKSAAFCEFLIGPDLLLALHELGKTAMAIPEGDRLCPF
jgi:hypothetical protein